MPLISRIGAASSRGFGQLATQASGKYIEDYFSTYLYTGNGGPSQTIVNGISLGTTIAQPVGTFSSNQAIAAANNPALLVDAFEDFTAECWVNQTDYNSNQFLFGKLNTSVGDAGTFFVLSSNVGQWNVWFNGSTVISGSNTPQTNTWFHVAVSRSGSTVRLFVNGTNVGSGSYFNAITNTGTFKVGAAETAGFQYQLKGYVTNMRFVKGTALYTSNFTPPTSQLTAISGTSLLTLQSPSLFVDNSPNNITITNYSVTSTTTGSPFLETTPQGAGLVWIKGRNNSNAATGHFLADTVRGRGSYLKSQSTAGAVTSPDGYDFNSFNSSGFTLGSPNQFSLVNSSVNYATWTWRTAPKFFDVVTYTGTGATQTIAHNLGSVPGMIIVKKTSASGSWPVYHRSLTYTNYMFLDLNFASTVDSGGWVAAPTATNFTVGGYNDWNQSGQTYVAYLFAHDAGGFGADGSQNVISCGSYTTDASAKGSATLGFEPQFIIAKASSAASDWCIIDVMRGASYSNTQLLLANNTGAEYSTGASGFIPNATGFTDGGQLVANGTVIYVAIRRGPMRTPTSGTSVFSPIAVTASTPTTRTTGFPVDTQFINEKSRASWPSSPVFDRLRGVSTNTTNDGIMLSTSSTAAESSVAATLYFSNTGYNDANYYSTLPVIAWNFGRAPGFFDVVCYTANGAGSLSLSHNLNAVPQMMVVKGRSGASDWPVYHIGENGGVNPEQYYLRMNATSAASNAVANWGNTAPTATQFTVGGNNNASGYTYIAYLFASCPGVSKVGSYTGTGATQTISCGFTGGARYVLIKRTDSTGDWWVWDTARGMVAGTDPRLPLNSAVAETNANWVYTTTGGFQIVTSDATVNASGGSYIYLAIA